METLELLFMSVSFAKRFENLTQGFVFAVLILLSRYVDLENFYFYDMNAFS